MLSTEKKQYRWLYAECHVKICQYTLGFKEFLSISVFENCFVWK